MRYNVETMELRRGNQTLTAAQEFIGGVVRYIGRVDGRPCVQSPTKEGGLLPAAPPRLLFGGLTRLNEVCYTGSN
ncbi:MAG: hypothetical protein HZY74_05960 [Brevundimonas sp.]|nr:MAG: hypothetical protein HZY74_05960 [Brevundimonas sp.]